VRQPSSVQSCCSHAAPKRRRFGVSCLVLTALLLASAPEQLAACSFHTSLSGNTLSNHIAGSVELVAMRPSTQNPFRFVPTEQFKGISSDSRPPHLVDSTTRRRLEQNLDHAVLFARGPDGQWTRLMFLDEDNRRIAEEILANAGSWATPSGASGKRDYFFAKLLRHPSRDIKYMALRELDAMSYEVLRGGTYPVTVEDLLSGIMDLQNMAFAPIKILLIGMVGGEDAERAIFQQLHDLALSGSAHNLGAWITAAIETADPRGIDKLEREFLDSDRSLARPQLIEIVRAMSVQSNSGRSDLRTALDAAVRRLVGRYPEAAPMVAQAFGTASDWSQVGLVRDLIANDAFPKRSDLMAAVAYVSQSGQRERSRRHPLLRTGMRFKSPPGSP
jgi:hypothetical protein